MRPDARNPFCEILRVARRTVASAESGHFRYPFPRNGGWGHQPVTLRDLARLSGQLNTLRLLPHHAHSGAPVMMPRRGITGAVLLAIEGFCAGIEPFDRGFGHDRRRGCLAPRFGLSGLAGVRAGATKGYL